MPGGRRQQPEPAHVGCRHRGCSRRDIGSAGSAGHRGGGQWGLDARSGGSRRRGRRACGLGTDGPDALGVSRKNVLMETHGSPWTRSRSRTPAREPGAQERFRWACPPKDAGPSRAVREEDVRIERQDAFRTRRDKDSGGLVQHRPDLKNPPAPPRVVWPNGTELRPARSAKLHRLALPHGVPQAGDVGRSLHRHSRRVHRRLQDVSPLTTAEEPSSSSATSSCPAA